MAGVQRATDRASTIPRVLQGTLVITEYRNKNANTCSFIAKGFTPSDGDRVVITLGGADNPERLFLGTVVIDNRHYIGTPSNGQVTVNCIDNTRLLNQRKVTKVYASGTTVRAVVLDLIANYTSGFTTTNVAADLGTLESDCSFTELTVGECLTQLTKRTECEGDWYLDYEGTYGDLHVFQTETLAAAFTPTALTSANDDFWDASVTTDGGGVITRVRGEGGGSNCLQEIAVSETIVPVEDPAWYDTDGGQFAAAHNRGTYTGVDEGGGGSLVGSGASPSTAPTLALAAGTGVTTGSHQVAVTFVTAAGESLVGPRATLTVGTVSAPTSAATAGTPSSGGSMNAGTHRYYAVFRTATGSTTAGPVSNAVTAVAAASNPSTTPAMQAFLPGGTLSTWHSWAYTFVRNSDGTETTPSTGSTFTNFTGSNSGARIRVNETPPSGFSLRLYRADGFGSTDYYRVLSYTTEDAGGGVTDLLDYGSSLGAIAPTSNNTHLGICAVTNIPVSTDALVTHVDMYREFNSAGASTAKLAFSVTNGTTSANDSVANAGLGATVPSSNTATANRISATNIAIGGATVTSRKVYMTTANNDGGTLKLVTTIGDNSTTTLTISTADASLGADAPSSDTSGLTQPSGQILPGATSILVAGTAPFKSTGGWAIVGQQVIRYTGFSGSSLTGVPASGTGSITAVISYNTTIFAAPQLTGCSGILYTIPKGEPINLYVVVNDTAAQATLAARLGANYGIAEDFFQDRRLGLAELTARAQARLAFAKNQQQTLRWKSRYKNTRAGRDISATLPELNVSDTFKIQQVTISNFQPAEFPTFDAVGSNQLFTFEDLLRLARETNKAA